MEFHVSRLARDRYKFDQALFTLSGNIIFANFHAARTFARTMNQQRDVLRFPEQAVRTGEINALGLIDEILHYVVQLYRQQRKPDLNRQALAWLEEKFGRETLDELLATFTDEFPPLAVYRRELDVQTHLNGETEGASNREVALEELILLWLANVNPAFVRLYELFDHSRLRRETAYPAVIASLNEFFLTQPTFGPDNQSLIEMLRSPALARPHSIPGQLEYIREKWGHLLGKYLVRLLSGLDLIEEEERAVFLGPGPAHVYDFTGLELEPERFSQDREWMPRVILMAKNAHVWLDQLSRRHGRHIHLLDQIPDEELDRLSGWGFTGLWLIGLWERSPASRKIKQLCGNPDAVSSAYSLFDYSIAADLGGEAAYENLRERAWKRGIRLASDMVPNHMGIDSKWLVEHPDWFISQDYSPFPSYTFSGPDLSWDDRVGIYIEDHYYDRSDAAVVFKRVDRHTGKERYVYHGNDGTSMPWNDTAQLNFLNPETREAVIQTILHVARKFPIIRFDAAMTLAKKHYQRLWFPEPGTGGAIPSRAEHGMSKARFDALMPEEFWREVVDRVAQEVPDTLLLAEAFWLMEGYFVRTLGMHRVYNSAFMNMLRDEENANYRSVMKNTLEFDPEILKRFVNFMNNPDERTAVDQFGKGDKYFGVCTMMVTLPGLPMFGHGQVEGFAEKYGMEYHRAYWDEEPDRQLMERHQREIFPLLHRRHLFAEVENFFLYDFFTPEGHVNEDVFAYSNRAGGERSLVVYHNKFAATRGWVRTSVAFAEKGRNPGDRVLVQKGLGEGLGLRREAGYFTLFRDHVSGLEFIRENRDLHERGLFVELEAYKHHVFLDFRQVQDNEWQRYEQLCEYLDGRGVPDLEKVAQEILLRPVHHPYRELVNAGMFRWLIENRVEEPNGKIPGEVQEETREKIEKLVQNIRDFTGARGEIRDISGEIKATLDILLRLPALEADLPARRTRKFRAALRYLKSNLDGASRVWGTLIGWCFTHSLGRVVSADNPVEVSRSWIDEWLLGKILARTLQELGLAEPEAWEAVALVKILTTYQRWHLKLAEGAHQAYPVLEALLSDVELQGYLRLNRYQDILWFQKEALETLAWHLYAVAVLDIAGEGTLSGEEKSARIIACYEFIQDLLAAAVRSDYQLEKLLELAVE